MCPYDFLNGLRDVEYDYTSVCCYVLYPSK